MISNPEINDWTPKYFIGNRSNCKSILDDPKMRKEIPLINNAPLHNFKDQQLVRFRGMIQDMYNPEFYFQQFEVKNIETGECDVKSGLYADAAHCTENEEILLDSEKNQSSERQTCVVISVPGLNDWAKEKYEYPHKTEDKNLTICSKYKRSLNECEEMDCSESVPKRERTVAQESNMDTDCATESDKNLSSIVSKDHLLNFPVPINDGKACIVKIYEDISLKLNQVIEVIGFISLDPLLSCTKYSDDTMTEAEKNTHHPPASLVPRLHAIKVSHIVKHEISNAPEIISKAQSIRSDLHLILSQLLFGDHLAADYLICHLLSTIYMRKDFLCLGTYPLNITHFPATKYKQFPSDFYNILSLFVQKSHLLEITLKNLNDFALLPKKDYECDRLTSGILQLSNNTHLVVDETGLTTGQLSQAGRDNYNAICDLINFQKVKYDFKYYTMEYDADIPVLIFSEAKSFIPCHTQIILKMDVDSENLYPQIVEMINQYLKDENRLTNIRQYIEVLKHAEFKFNEDIVKVVQEDFIQMRQKDENINADHLHALMILARLISLSNGSDVLTSEYWKRAVEMETERLNRLPSHK